MKTDLRNLGLACWRLLSEVPGWPDAPRWMRWRRALPMIVPCAGMVLLATWNKAVWEPRIRNERAGHQEAVAIEEEISALRLEYSDQQAADLAVQAEVAGRLLLPSPAALGPLLATFKQAAAERHWEGNFQAADASDDTPEPEVQVIFLPVRAKLSATTSESPEAFPALLSLLEYFSSSEKRIDLIRVGIRADEQGRYAVELNLRLACRRTHEKTAQ